MNFNKDISKKTKLLLICGPAGSILFTVMFLIQGAIREDYTALRFPISSLSIGNAGWIQISNFIISGTLIFLFAFGLRQSTLLLKGSLWTSRLIGAVGLGLIGAGIFSSDPVFGYPITSPLAIAQFTVHGHLHDFFSIFVFICLPIACFKFHNRFKESNEKGWARYSLFSGIAMLVAFFLAAVGFKQTPGFIEVAGVFQRLSIIIGFGWMTMLAFYIINAFETGSKKL
jgi:hypothetical protein